MELGIPASTISTWWKRGMCDMWVLINHLGEYSADYLITGNGPKKLKDRSGVVMYNHQEGRYLNNEMNSVQEKAYSPKEQEREKEQERVQEQIKKLEADNEFLKEQIRVSQANLIAAQEQLKSSQEQLNILLNMLASKN